MCAWYTPSEPLDGVGTQNLPHQTYHLAAAIPLRSVDSD